MEGGGRAAQEGEMFRMEGEGEDDGGMKRRGKRGGDGGGEGTLEGGGGCG
jgi:hypothetical protein